MSGLGYSVVLRTLPFGSLNSGHTATLRYAQIGLLLADELLQFCEQKGRRPYFDKFICIVVEKDVENFRNFQTVVDREKENIRFKDKIDILPINDEFAKGWS